MQQRAKDIARRMAGIQDVVKKQQADDRAEIERRAREQRQYEERRQAELEAREARRRKMREDMLKVCTIQLENKNRRREEEHAADLRFAEHMRQEDRKHHEMEKKKRQAEHRRYKEYQKEILRLEKLRREKTYFEDPPAVLGMNLPILKSIKNESDNVNVDEILTRMPKIPSRQLKKRKNRTKLPSL